LSTRKEFDDLKLSKQVLPLLGLFTLDHMSYEIDRDPTIEPSLKEMTEKAIRILEKATADSDKGFFLMIEGSRIDMAGHSNDAPTQVHDVFAYHETIKFVKEYVDENSETIMISVSDHETGGLSLARQNTPDYPDYIWYPEVLSKVKSSAYVISEKIKNYSGVDRVEYIKKLIEEDLGITDYTTADIDYLNQEEQYFEAHEFFLANMTSHRAELGWATHGHSGVDVNLYAYGNNIEALRGNHENTDIGDFIVDYLDLNLHKITTKLNSNQTFHLERNTTVKSNMNLIHHHHHISH